MIDEDLIQRILAKNPELNRNQILANLKAQQEKTGGLIADETLLRLIAARYGIETVHRITLRRFCLGDLVAGLNDVTVTGRVVAVYPPRTFEGKRSGKVANLMITDKDNALRVVLWDDNVGLLESGELKSGQIVRFAHGYTRQDQEGKVELHLGRKSQIEVKHENANAEEYPSIDKFTTKINEVATNQSSINLIGTVKEVYTASTFTRSDTTTGTVMRLKLTDETGEIPVVAWNEKAAELEKTVKVNSGLQLLNAKVKKNGNGELEIHINSYTYVEVS
jgi:ssDNA-binding replication factor A large subunit